MARPVGLLYGVDQSPPPGVLAFSTLQHVALIANSLLYPVILATEAGLSPERVIDFVSLAILALGVSTLLLCARSRFVGSGYLCPASYSLIYLAPSLYALQQGGLAAVFGMTLIAGLVQVGIAPLLRRLRALLPPEIGGLVVAITGLSLAVLGARYSLGISADSGVKPAYLAVALCALVTMIALNVWTKGYTRMLCGLIGATVGSCASFLLGVPDLIDVPMAGLDFLRFPVFGEFGWRFDVTLLPAFMIAAIASTVHLMGNISTAQKINDTDWVRPDLQSLRGGLAGSGLGSAFCGLVGSLGIVSSSPSIGLSNAAGITSRSLGYCIGAAVIVLSFVPVAAVLLVITTAPVLGASLFFTALFIFANGLEMITARMLDTRKILVIGFSFTMAVMADIYRDVFATMPAMIQPVFSNSLVLGTACAVLLNLIMRIGVHQRESLRLESGSLNREAVEQFISQQGARWAARREIVSRAIFGVVQVLEVLGDKSAGAEVEVSFDEFNLDARIRHTGAPLVVPDRKPTPREIVASEDGERLLAGYLLRRSADEIDCRASGDRAEVHLHYDH